MNLHSMPCADLHLHTNHSDGTYTPEEVVSVAKNVGLTTIAITDHDTLDGVAPAQAASGRDGPEVVAGVELGTPADDGDLPEAHIVGLFVDDDNAELRGALESWRALRRERIGRICEKLNRVGVALRPEEVFALAGGTSVGRLHVARALVAGGFTSTINVAFKQWLGTDGSAYVPRQCASGAELVGLIHRAGGVAVLAHPQLNVKDEEIPAFAAIGIDAIEVYLPEQSAADEQHYLEIARDLGLLVSGGSDCHGESSRCAVMGAVRLEMSLFEALKERAAEYAEGSRDV